MAMDECCHYHFVGIFGCWWPKIHRRFSFLFCSLFFFFATVECYLYEIILYIYYKYITCIFSIYIILSIQYSVIEFHYFSICLFLQAGKGAPYYVGASQTLPRGMYSDRNKNVIGKFCLCFFFFKFLSVFSDVLPRWRWILIWLRLV